MQYTFLADYKGEISYDEPHMVKWVPFQKVIDGSFGEYNQLVAKSLTSMGIPFKMSDNNWLTQKLDELLLASKENK